MEQPHAQVPQETAWRLQKIKGWWRDCRWELQRGTAGAVFNASESHGSISPCSQVRGGIPPNPDHTGTTSSLFLRCCHQGWSKPSASHSSSQRCLHWVRFLLSFFLSSDLTPRWVMLCLIFLITQHASEFGRRRK